MLNSKEKIMKKIYYILFLLTVIFQSSCTKDFLEKYPYSKVATEKSITSVEDAQVALVGVYSGFTPEAYYGRYFTVLPDVMSDEVLSTIGYTNQLGTFYKWEFSPGDDYINDMWAQMYSVITRANNIINVIDGFEGEASDKNQIKGEALLARAIAYFDLVRSYAVAYNSSSSSTDLGVPVVLEYQIGQPARNTVEEAYQQILSDALTAKDLMINQSVDDVFLTPAAADAFLARVYLYMQNYTKAAEFATYVIDDYGYELANQSNYNDLWLNDTGNEIIWKISYTLTDQLRSGPGYNYYDFSQNPTNADYIPSDQLLNLYDQVNDIRYSSFFNQVDIDWIETVCTKYPTNPEFSTPGNNMIKVFRLSEVYLIRAEALAELNKDELAMSDLNILRQHRIVGYTDENLTGKVLKDAIWTERLKELCFEGHRFFDLKRKSLGFTRQSKANTNPGFNELSISPNNHRWVWPIPQHEINANQNMVQNPNY
jgi:starch-binding outer membrane protein, SusD/RagB family